MYYIVNSLFWSKKQFFFWRKKINVQRNTLNINVIYSQFYVYLHFFILASILDENMIKWRPIKCCLTKPGIEWRDGTALMIRLLLLGYKVAHLGVGGLGWCAFFTSLCTVGTANQGLYRRFPILAAREWRLEESWTQGT